VAAGGQRTAQRLVCITLRAACVHPGQRSALLALRTNLNFASGDGLAAMAAAPRRLARFQRTSTAAALAGLGTRQAGWRQRLPVYQHKSAD
jgi:hypothetical protein